MYLIDQINQLLDDYHYSENRDAFYLENLATANDFLEQIEAKLSQNDENKETYYLYKILLHFHYFNNNNAALETAQTVLEKENFSIGNQKFYDWISYIYSEELNMPQKAKEILIEELLEIPNWNAEKYKITEIEADILYKIAHIEWAENNPEAAIKNALLSFEKYPFIHERNEILTLELLQNNRYDEVLPVLMFYYKWHQEYSSEKYDEIVKLLKKKHQNLELKNPELLSVYFLILSEYYSKNTDFQKLEAEIKMYESEIGENYYTNIAMAILYGALNNDKKAYEYRKKAAGIPNNYFNVDVNFLFQRAQKYKDDFFKIEFTDQLRANELYNLSTYFLNLSHKGERKDLLDYALRFAEKGYQMYNDYFTKNIGDNYNNQPYIFAMLCNNYALMIRYKNFDIETNSANIFDTSLASQIHWQGYQMSPFYDNLDNAIWCANNSENDEEIILYANTLLKDFEDSLSDLDLFQQYYYIICAYANQNKIEEMLETYNLAKERYFDTRGAKILGENEIIKHIFCAQHVCITLSKLPQYKPVAIELMKEFLNINDFYYYLACEYVLVAQIYATLIEDDAEYKDDAIYYSKMSIDWYNQNLGNINRFYKRSLVKAKITYLKCTKDYDAIAFYADELLVLFPYPEIEFTSQFPLSPENENQNAEILLKMMLTLENEDDNYSCYTDTSNTSYVNFNNSYDNKVEIKVCSQEGQEMVYYNYVVDSTEKRTGFFNLKKETVCSFSANVSFSNEEKPAFSIIENKSKVSENEFLNEKNIAQYWWNLICNRFFYLMNL